MTAPMIESPCRLCHGILPKKQRRTVFGDTFEVFDQLLEVLDIVPQLNDDKGKYICWLCWNKLNKLSKIEYDLKTKLQAEDEIKNNIQNECDKKQSGKKCPPVSKLVDISAMASELVSIFDIVPGREYQSFTGFKDVFLNIS